MTLLTLTPLTNEVFRVRALELLQALDSRLQILDSHRLYLVRVNNEES